MKKFFTCLLATIGLTTACGQKNYEDVNQKGGILDWKKAGMDVTTDNYEVDVFKTKSGKAVKFHALASRDTVSSGRPCRR